MFGYKEPKQIAPAAAQPIPATHNIKVALFTAGLISLSLHGLQIAKHGVDSIFSTGRCQVQAQYIPPIPEIPQAFAQNEQIVNMHPPVMADEEKKIVRHEKAADRRNRP